MAFVLQIENLHVRNISLMYVIKSLVSCLIDICFMFKGLLFHVQMIFMLFDNTKQFAVSET